MNDNAKKWVAALRSGKFDQTQYALRNSCGFCCLGVACEVYQAEVGDLEITGTADDNFRYDGSEGILPQKVQDWIGLRAPNGENWEGEPVLIALNDEDKLTFDEIANQLETVEGYFV